MKTHSEQVQVIIDGRKEMHNTCLRGFRQREFQTSLLS